MASIKSNVELEISIKNIQCMSDRKCESCKCGEISTDETVKAMSEALKSANEKEAEGITVN